jgi:hypothetical protein
LLGFVIGCAFAMNAATRSTYELVTVRLRC